MTGVGSPALRSEEAPNHGRIQRIVGGNDALMEPRGPEPRTLLSGLGMGESPRWHDGGLWFSDWGTNEIVAVDLNENEEVMGRGGGGRRLGRQLAPGRTHAHHRRPSPALS
jgi:hypothetical protein